MRIIYDNIVFAIQKCGGISVVWQELLEHLSQCKDSDVRYIDVDNHIINNISRGKIKISEKDVIHTINFPQIERYLPVRISESKPFIFHSSYYRYCTNPNAINIVTVHDFIYELFIKGIKQKIHSWQKFSAIRHSDAIVCISENTKRDLIRLMPGVDERKIHVIYNGVSEAFCFLGNTADISLLPFPPKSYVVFIAKRDSYKNFDLAVRGVAATNLNLLIVGSPLDEAEKRMVEHILPSARYHCVSQVPDSQLNLIYNHAAALVYPSSYEGFGIPILEAQCAGCPVIAFNASSIPEVIGDTPLLMNELTEQELKSKLDLLSDTQLMQNVKAKGFSNVQRFSWQKMANEYAALYHQLLKNIV